MVNLDDTWANRLRFGGWKPIALFVLVAVAALLFVWQQRAADAAVGSERCRQAYAKATSAADTSAVDLMMADGPSPRYNEASVSCGALRAASR